MTRSVKRSATTSHDRARPLKWRRTAGGGEGVLIDLTRDSHKEDKGAESGASTQSTQEEEKQWPANRILDERVKGTRKQYLVEWEPDPNTGFTYEPTWVGSSLAS